MKITERLIYDGYACYHAHHNGCCYLSLCKAKLIELFGNEVVATNAITVQISTTRRVGWHKVKVSIHPARYIEIKGQTVTINGYTMIYIKDKELNQEFWVKVNSAQI